MYNSSDANSKEQVFNRAAIIKQFKLANCVDLCTLAAEFFIRRCPTLPFQKMTLEPGDHEYLLLNVKEGDDSNGVFLDIWSRTLGPANHRPLDCKAIVFVKMDQQSKNTKRLMHVPVVEPIDQTQQSRVVFQFPIPETVRSKTI